MLLDRRGRRFPVPGRLLLPLAAALWFPVALPAQAVRGLVREDSSGSAIAGATIQLLAGGEVAASTRSDSLGAFRLRLRSGGHYTVRLEHPSYLAPAPDTVTIGGEETVSLELRMARTAIPLAPLLVTARGPDSFGGFYRRLRQPGFGRFLTRSDIERRPGGRVSDLLRTVPGLYVVPSRPAGTPGSVNLIAMRGLAAGRCLPTFYIDGMPLRQLPDAGVDAFLTVDMLEGVEIYPSTAGLPAEFLQPDNCGVVAFWTREDIGTRFSWKRLGVGMVGFALLVLLARS